MMIDLEIKEKNTEHNIAIGVVGLGNMGQVHCRVAHKLGTLAAVADINETVARETGQKYDVPSFKNWQDLIREVSIDGLILAVPTKFHYPLAKEVLQNHPSSMKAILIEKPITETIDQALAIEELSTKKKILVTIGHSEVFNPVIPAMIDLVEKDAIGNIRSILVQRRGSVPLERIPSLGDVLEDIGVHDFDIVLRVLKPRKAWISCHGLTTHGFINTAHVTFLTDENQMVSFLFSREYAGRVRRIEIEGTKATMKVNLLDQWLQIHSLNPLLGDASSVTFPIASGQIIKYYGEPVMEEHLAFYNSIKTRKDTRVAIRDAIKTLQVVDAARKSHETKRPIKIEFSGQNVRE